MEPIRRIVPLLVLVALAGCQDGELPSDPALTVPAGPAASLVSADDVRAGIAALFPLPGLRTAALAQFRNVERRLEAGDLADARQKALDLVAFSLERYAADQLLDPAGAADPTTESALAALVSDLYLFVQLGSPPPVQVHGGPDDQVVAIVGAGGGTVTTGEGHAGVQISDDAIDETTLITIARRRADPCLPTGLQQFEGCYTFEKTPAAPFLEEVTVGVCVDPAAVTDPAYDRMQLHKFDPDHPSAGVVPLENAPAPFLDCSDFTVATAAAPWLLRLASAGLDRLAGWIARPLYAAHLGAGGMTISFSHIGWATPPEFAFTSDRDGNPEIYRTNPAGQGVLRLTNDPALDRAPKWSPDTTRIAFTTDRDGDLEAYTMDGHGGSLLRLTNRPGYDQAHSWAPDGSQISYTSERNGVRETWILEADGSDERLHISGAGSPKFSPDGTLMAYESVSFLHPGVLDVWVTAVDGPYQLNVTNDGFNSARPAWSPDGTRLAYTTWRHGDAEVYVINADGTNPRRLTHHGGTDQLPVWSPDGSMIAFESDRDGDFEIYVMDALAGDTSPLTRVTDNAAEDRNADWKPR